MAAPSARCPWLAASRSKEDRHERRQPRKERDVNIHRDAYTVVIAMLVFAGLITILLVVVNPIR
jgi:hypothetical protein